MLSGGSRISQESEADGSLMLRLFQKPPNTYLVLTPTWSCRQGTRTALARVDGEVLPNLARAATVVWGTNNSIRIRRAALDPLRARHIALGASVCGSTIVVTGVCS
jgi:hypothetical protein